jgi:hypothetical protein
MEISKSLLALAVTALASVNALAGNFEFQNIRVGGSGCPGDTTQIVTAPDLSSASLIFQGFESHVPTAQGPKGGTNISILNCNVFLDIKLPAGQKLESLEVSYDMRGHAFLDRGVTGNFKSFLMSSAGLGTDRGGRGPELLQEKNWLNTSIDQEEDFTVRATKTIILSSQCGNGNAGDRVSLHLQHQLGSQILSTNTRSEGTITMDSSDMAGGIRLRATTSICRATPPGGGGGNDGGRGNGRNCHVERVNGRAVMICN